MLHQMMNCLFHKLNHNALVLKNPGLRKSYDEMLLTALLSLPHNQREKLFEDRRYQVSPGLVRRAEEYMQAHLEEAVSITDLLQIAAAAEEHSFGTRNGEKGYTPDRLTKQPI